MSQTQDHTSPQKLSPAFEKSRKSRMEKARPFSLWLSPGERSALEQLAGEQPLGTFIKGKALGGAEMPSTRKTYRPVEDKKAIAKALAMLGQSRMASNLNQLAKAANIGTLPLTPDVEEDLQEACAHVREIKALLVNALGLKSSSTGEGRP